MFFIVLKVKSCLSIFFYIETLGIENKERHQPTENGKFLLYTKCSNF